jgi:hypothetical protein
MRTATMVDLSSSSPSKSVERTTFRALDAIRSSLAFIFSARRDMVVVASQWGVLFFVFRAKEWETLIRRGARPEGGKKGQ